MNKVNVINNLNQTELEQGIAGTTASWHHKYLASDAIWVGGLSPSITEDRLLAILEQYGTVLHINLLRDANTSESKGYAFVRYADSRSCVLAVDNFTGFEIDGRNLRVDHVENYRMPEDGGTDTTPDGFHESQAADAEHNSEALAEEATAEKRRQKAVMERLESLRKRKRIHSTSQAEARDSKRRELSTLEDKVEPTSARNNALIEDTNHTTHATVSESYRREKEQRRREKEKRRQERARIRKRRAEKKAQQDHTSRA